MRDGGMVGGKGTGQDMAQSAAAFMKLRALEYQLTQTVKWLRFSADELYLTRRHDPSFDELAAKLPRREGAVPEASSAPTVFCAADREYFREFLPTIAASLSRVSGTARLHVHLYGDPGPEEAPTWAMVESLLGAGRVTLSHEQFQPEHWAGRRKLLYFQSVRFARLLQMIRLAPQPVLLVDVDAMFVRPLCEFLSHTSDCDVAAPIRPGWVNDGRRISAAAVYVAATDRGRAFLEDAAARMLLHLLFGRDGKFLDQRCLYGSLFRIPSLKVVHLPREAASSKPLDTCLFTPPGAAKAELGRFRPKAAEAAE